MIYVPLRPNLTRRYVYIKGHIGQIARKHFLSALPEKTFLVAPKETQSPPSSLAIGLRLRLLALPFAGGRPFPFGGGLTNAKSTSMV